MTPDRSEEVDLIDVLHRARTAAGLAAVVATDPDAEDLDARLDQCVEALVSAVIVRVDRRLTEMEDRLLVKVDAELVDIEHHLHERIDAALADLEDP